ncbi:MAG: ATP-binding protein [Treponema sp.]|nr:ATP-binding protein [Treponema sp.]
MSVKELTLEAKVANLQQVLDFVDENLTSMRCPMKILMQIDVAVEEIFVNVASYAYTPNTGSVTIRMDLQEKPRAVVITFIDSGIPYNPLAKEDPDVSLSAEERSIGGLGIFMVKKTMDKMEYEYTDQKNVLKMYKNIE